MLLKLVQIAFRQFFEVILWITLIGSTLWGVVAGAMTRNVGLALLGLIVGALMGALICVVWGGLIAVILNIDANLEKVAGGKGVGQAAEPAAAPVASVAVAPAVAPVAAVPVAEPQASPPVQG